MTDINETPEEINNEAEPPETWSCDSCCNEFLVNDTDESDEHEYQPSFEIQSSTICDDCVAEYTTICCYCEEQFFTEDCRWLDDSDDYWCESCWDRRVSYCSRHDYHYSDSNGCYRCEDDPEEDEDEGLIKGYCYKPRAEFHFVSTRHGKKVILSNANAMPSSVDKPTLGIELETEAVHCDRYDGARLAQEIFGSLAYLKSDGSLNNGYEIVTHPFTLDYWRERVDTTRLRELANMGMRSSNTNTCGLHIHVGRKYFQKNITSMYRFMALFHANNEQWRKIAGRSESTYARWSDQERENMMDYIRYITTHGRIGQSANFDRYVALNLQNHSTIELRFFKGTLNARSLNARIEAVDAACRFARNMVYKGNIKQSYSWDKFRQFATDEGYTTFSEYATEKGV